MKKAYIKPQIYERRVPVKSYIICGSKPVGDPGNPEAPSSVLLGETPWDYQLSKDRNETFDDSEW